MDDASRGCQREDKSKLFPVCNQEVSMSETDAYVLSQYGCSHAWMFPGTLKTEKKTPKGTHRDQAFPKRYVPEGTTMSALAGLKLFKIFCFLFYTMSIPLKKKQKQIC